MKTKGALDGRVTLDTHQTKCGCGKMVYLLRRKNLVLLPHGHRCKYKDRQDDQKRTIRAIESAGMRVTPGEAARRLSEALRS